MVLLSLTDFSLKIYHPQHNNKSAMEVSQLNSLKNMRITADQLFLLNLIQGF